MENNIDWDAELARAQFRLETGLSDSEILIAAELFKEELSVLVERVQNVIDAFAEVFANLADKVKDLFLSLQEHFGGFKRSAGEKRAWREQKHQKRPFLFVAYNQIPAKRPLHNGRRGRR